MTGSTQGTNGRSEPRPERGRFSSRRKAEAVLRLLHGEELDALSRELGVTAATLAQWREYMGAGYSKVYSLMIDGFPMYDSRVACALTSLIWLYCGEKHLVQIPEQLCCVPLPDSWTPRKR